MGARFDTIRTKRLVMRRWRDSDREPYAALNADPVVMRYFPATHDRASSNDHVDRMEKLFVDGSDAEASKMIIASARPRISAAKARLALLRQDQ